MSGSSVAVTGATGFIGHVLVQSLIKNGWKVRALTRTPRINDESTQWILGDLDDPIALQSLVQDVSAVVHCAGLVRGSSLKETTQRLMERLAQFVREIVQHTQIPTLMIFKAGEVEATKVGAASKSQLAAFIDQAL